MANIDLFRGNRGLPSNFRNSLFSSDPLFRRMDQMFQELTDEFFGQGSQGGQGLMQQSLFRPAVDIDENDKELIINVEVPGIKREDMNIELSGRTLHISGERKDERKQGEGSQRYMERRYGRFERSFMLPETIDVEHADAQFENGELRLVFPKKEMSQRRRIDIKEGGRLPEGAQTQTHDTTATSSTAADKPKKSA